MDLPNPGIKPGSPAVQADSLPTELDIVCKNFASLCCVPETNIVNQLWCLALSCFSYIQLFVPPWTVACGLLSPWGGFSRQEYWSGLPCPPPGYLSEPGIEPTCLMDPALQADSLLLSHWEVPDQLYLDFKKCRQHKVELH